MVANVISTVPNYSFYSIPAMWLVSFMPHPYAIICAGDRFKNTSPRQMVSDLMAKKDKTDNDKKVIRAESAQANGFENIGLFAAAVVAANYAGVPNGELNTLTGAYLGSRVLYNLLYIFVTSESTSNLRSGVFVSGVGIIFTLFIKAGNRLL